MCLMECLEFSWIQFYKTFLVVAFCLSLVQNKYKGMEYEKLCYGTDCFLASWKGKGAFQYYKTEYDKKNCFSFVS